MKQVMKLILIGGALLISTPFGNAERSEPMTVAFKYDRTASIETTFNKARKTARKACQINGRLVPLKRVLERDCVTPMLEQFVLGTKNQDLVAYYEEKTGKPITGNRFVAY